MHSPQNFLNQFTEEEVIIQLVVFRCGNEEFGIEIESVNEIIKAGQITPIPHLPEFIKGIINVRGEIVTTLDIKLQFSLTHTSQCEPKHIIVIKSENSLFGLIVDEVIEILRVDKNDIKPRPMLVNNIQMDYVRGIIFNDNRFIILLDLRMIFSQDELRCWTTQSHHPAMPLIENATDHPAPEVLTLAEYVGGKV